MNIPENGRVVVIDDKYEEVESLLKMLSKNKVPVMYFTGVDKDELPEQPFSDIRVIFLDIVLGTEGQQDKTKISTAYNVINRVIGANNTPYLIIVWTKHNELIKGIEEKLKENPPIIMLNLEKSECKDAEGKYEMDKIERKLKEELKKAGIFHLFIIWENLVHKSAGKIVTDFSSFYNQKNNWNKNMCGVLYKLAKAYAGETLKDANTAEIVRNALLTFNGTFLDTLENEIRLFKGFDTALSVNDRNTIEPKILAKINSRLLLVMEKSKRPMPGQVYYGKNGKYKIKIDDLFEGNIGQYQKKDDLITNIKDIFLEVSPVCDYAQKKWRVHRVLPGLMWTHAHFNKIKKKADYMYTSPMFEIESNLFKLVFDLRYLTSLSDKVIRGKTPAFKLRYELLVDIQSCISKHINRPGVTFLE